MDSFRDAQRPAMDPAGAAPADARDTKRLDAYLAKVQKAEKSSKKKKKKARKSAEVLGSESPRRETV
jgi:hypothetical protein